MILKGFGVISKNFMPDGSRGDFVQLVDQDSNEVVVDSETPKFINSFFVGIGPKLSENMYDMWKPYEAPVQQSLLEFSTTVNEVKDIIKSININKSSAVDNISNLIIKDAFSLIPDKITDMFNASFLSNLVPDKWKIATIVPIYKSGKL